MTEKEQFKKYKKKFYYRTVKIWCFRGLFLTIMHFITELFQLVQEGLLFPRKVKLLIFGDTVLDH